MDMCHVNTALQLLGPCVALLYAGYTNVIPTKLHTTNFVREQDQRIHHGNNLLHNLFSLQGMHL